MVEDDRYCMDVLTQIGAVSKALESLALEVLDEHVRHCVAGALASGDEQRRRREERGASSGRAALRADQLAAARPFHPPLH